MSFKTNRLQTMVGENLSKLGKLGEKVETKFHPET
jgi:hypothetical protein